MMAWTQPPQPLTQEEFNQRIKNGARTFREIDPEFCKWADGVIRYHKVCVFVLSIAVTIIFVTSLIILCMGCLK